MANHLGLHGGVIVPDDPGARGIIQLLTYKMRNRVALAYYPHAYDIDLDDPHDFLIVLSLADFERVIRYLDLKRQPIPLMVHIDTPDVLTSIDYARLYPGIGVLPVPQAPLGATPDTTLEINLFAKIVQRLEAENR